MKYIAVVTADFERTFLGLPSQLAADLRGETIIRRTIQRLSASTELTSVHLLVSQSQKEIAQSAVAGLNAIVEVHDAAPPPWIGYMSSARKWSLDGWRGGLAGTTVYDEFNHPWLLEALARRETADAVVDVPAAAPLIDPALLDNLLRHHTKFRNEARLGIVQSAPGLSAIVYQSEMLADLAKGMMPPGRTMTYRPDDPRHDIIMQPCLCPTDASISHAWGRCIADTSTAMSRVERLLDELANDSETNKTPDARTVSQWLLANRLTQFLPLPDEVEVELTTDDPLTGSMLRPRGRALERSGRMELATFQQIVQDLAACDDRRLVLGGFGDPLLHPQFPEFARIARKSGVLGIAVRTTAVTLDDPSIDALLDAQVDVMNVLIDAAGAETYRRIHRGDHYDRVLANIDRLCTVQQQRKCPRPLIVAELTKTPETMDDMEAFYDHWITKSGSAVIAGPSQYGGTWPVRPVINMAPPTRFACSRLFHRAMVLSDGRLTLCDQDYRGNHAVGRVCDSSLSDLWQSAALVEARKSHLTGSYNCLPLCSVCEEWHRP